MTREGSPDGPAALADHPAGAPAGGPVVHGRARRRGRRALVLAVLALVGVLAGGAWFQMHEAMPSWYARLWYPLDYEEEIRAEAARNDLDPALIAAVIKAESGFVADSRSSQRAVGLMQVLPETARYMAEGPDRPSPPPDRLEDPGVNIAYGSRYLRYLIDRYGTTPLALAAYNGGETNVAEWLDLARDRGEVLRVPEDIPFSETREFVARVLEAAPIYRRAYGERLFAPSREGAATSSDRAR